MAAQQPVQEQHQSGIKVALTVAGFMVGIIILVYVVKVVFGM